MKGSDNLYCRLLLLVWLVGIAARGSAQDVGCPPPTGVFGRPYDYTEHLANTPDWSGKTPIRVVENVHFTRDVEALRRGNTSEDPAGDLSYTLNAFPNHPRALWAVSRYQRQLGRPLKPFTAECFFERAVKFKPDDPMVRMIYGAHLHVSGKPQDALKQYKIAEKIAPDFSELQYNMGLLYFDLKQYALAKQYAQKAYQLGYPLPGLKEKLKGIGQWP
jgi:Tfp pilus assembly protein PilF